MRTLAKLDHRAALVSPVLLRTPMPPYTHASSHAPPHCKPLSARAVLREVQRLLVAGCHVA
jgi:hypothetical protein